MGAFFTNVQVFTGKRDKNQLQQELMDCCRKWLADQGYTETQKEDEGERSIVIAPGNGNWLMVMDEAWEEQDVEILDVAAGYIARELATTTAAVLVHDSDLARITLFRNGEAVDIYNSLPELCPEDLQHHSEERLKGDPQLWQDLLLPGFTVDQLREAWEEDAVCSEDIIFTTAELVGWDSELCCIGYNYLEQFDIEPLLQLNFYRKC